jgi:hypothetical protein
MAALWARQGKQNLLPEQEGIQVIGFYSLLM